MSRFASARATSLRAAIRFNRPNMAPRSPRSQAEATSESVRASFMLKISFERTRPPAAKLAWRYNAPMRSLLLVCLVSSLFGQSAQSPPQRKEPAKDEGREVAAKKNDGQNLPSGAGSSKGQFNTADQNQKSDTSNQGGKTDLDGWMIGLRCRKEITFTSATLMCYHVGYGHRCPTRPVLCWHVAASGRTCPPPGGRQPSRGTGLWRHFAGQPRLRPVARHVDQGC